VADALATNNVETLARARQNVPDWYSTIEDDPARLVDTVLLAMLARIEGHDVSSYLVGTSDEREHHTQRLYQTVDVGMAFLHADDRGPRFLNHADPDQLQKILAEPAPTEGRDFDTVLADVDERVLRYSIAQAHPGYLAFPDSGNALASLAGSMLTRLLNQNMIAVDRSAPAATFATIQVIEWLRELVGYDAIALTEMRGVRDVAGLWTTGGHMSNHVAMLAALGRRYPHVRTTGLGALDTRPAVVMAGPIAHYSHSDAAFHLGLGWDAVLQVPARADYTTDPDAVDALLSDPPNGITPFIVIGVAGNCRTTGLDDLSALAEVCRRHGVWFHVDACHGGSLIFNARLRTQCLAGIELADSVSLDPHKGLFTPYPSSYVVFRDRGVLNQFSRHSDSVNADGCWDLGLITPFFGSVGFEALATWMLLKHVGIRQLGALVEARQVLVRHLERRLNDSGLFICLNDVDFYRLAWVFCPPAVRAATRHCRSEDSRMRARQVVSQFTARLNDILYRRGEVCFDEHTLADLDDRVSLGAAAKYTIMAACPGNSLTTAHDIDRAVDMLVEAARPLVAPMVEALGTEVENAQTRVNGPAGWNDQ
jgi:glutamate/tyrosine decarboxylase-like PLP-dependent enzyme